jgi:zinc transporter ZupT
VGLATLLLNASRVRLLASSLVSFAIGWPLGNAFIYLMPETFATTTESMMQPSLLVPAGMLLFFVVEKLLPHRNALLRQRLDIHESTRPALAGI